MISTYSYVAYVTNNIGICRSYPCPYYCTLLTLSFLSFLSLSLSLALSLHILIFYVCSTQCGVSVWGIGGEQRYHEDGRPSKMGTSSYFATSVAFHCFSLFFLQNVSHKCFQCQYNVRKKIHDHVLCLYCVIQFSLSKNIETCQPPFTFYILWLRWSHPSRYACNRFVKPLHSKLFRGNINIYLHFVSFLHIVWHRYLKSFLEQEKDLHILYNQYRCCWCSHDIDLGKTHVKG